jgi:hypothetical protein
MTARTKAVFGAIVAAELGLIFLGLRHLRTDARSVASIAPLLKESLVFSEGYLKHYYEIKNTKKKPPTPSWRTEPADIRIDEDTLNTFSVHPIPKPSGTFRILTLGDSWTFGSNVDTKDNYSEALARSLNKMCSASGTVFDVVNLGVPGYDLQYSLERLRRRGVKYEPDLVLWLLHVNDFDEIAEYQLEYADRKAKALNLSPDEMRKLDPVALNMESQEQLKVDMGGKDAVLRYQEEALEDLPGIYQGRLAFATLPRTRIGLQPHHLAVLEEYVTAHPTTDIIELPTELGGDDLQPDYHPNAHGHELIARGMLATLKAEGFIVCN